MAPLASIASVSSRFAAKWKYVKTVCPGADPRPLVRLGFFYFDDHVGLAEHLVRPVDHGCANLLVGVIRQARALARRAFDDHAVAAADQLLGADWQHSDTVLVRFHLFGNANNHGVLKG